jgi:hypothetical protein
MTKQNSQSTALTPVERKHRAFQKRLVEIGWLIDNGYPVFVIARHPGMPALDKLWRWISASPELRRRYANATDWRRAQLADHTVALADELAGNTPAGKRLRIAIRKWRTDIERRPETPDAFRGPDVTH